MEVIHLFCVPEYRRLVRDLLHNWSACYWNILTSPVCWEKEKRYCCLCYNSCQYRNRWLMPLHLSQVSFLNQKCVVNLPMLVLNNHLIITITILNSIGPHKSHMFGLLYTNILSFWGAVIASFRKCGFTHEVFYWDANQVWQSPFFLIAL